MVKPKVTIGVCVRNNAPTIRETIESIIAQDFPHRFMEIMVVDGYSKDGTIPIIENCLRNTSIKTKSFCENKGLGYARQMIVDNAEGEYIVWVDGDMILPKDFVRKQVEFMERNPKVGIAKGKYGIIKEDSLVATLENIEFVMTFGKEREETSDPLGTSGCIYRVEAIKYVGGFDENIKGVGEDMDAEYRVRNAGWKLCVSPAHFYERRRRTWQALWKEYFWHGQGGFYILRKNRRVINVYKMLPPVALLAELLRVPLAYRLTRRSAAFLLPFHYVFKRIAWFLGFVKGKF